MSKPTNRITHLLTHWPTDHVRPASVSVQSFLQSRLPQSQQPQSATSPPSQTTTSTTTPPPISESSLNALSSLLEDRYVRRYPVPPRVRRPASNPDHYDDLVREFDEAPNRDWWGRLGKKVKGLFRFT
ncbi:ubiquinol-cytochrome c reductase complex assembly factor 2 [Aspergillus candidus]|uniref:Uncharacterized protein n=1 Tax=Aspergillus candidus TaxID=41067 RepID=A0A2I2EXY2_ASPCN|nr:hypothetical protein BDW47DRAFT_114358 [Aspergillus candidus]PLB33232.1 hypothetical protein BDW47DRAFT_114358 [Aspergillus candidus]